MVIIIKFIGFIIIFTIILILVLAVIPNYIHKKWLAYKHPDYNRALSSAETKFIENAQVSICDLSETPNFKKKWFGTFYVFGFVVMMIAVWLVLWLVRLSIRNLLNQKTLADTNIVYSHVTEFGFSGLVGLFCGIFLAGWLMYFLSGYIKGFWEWMVLTQGSHRSESSDSVLKRRLEQIEHDVRIKRLDVNAPFSTRAFLRGIAKRHQKYTGYPAYILMGIACIFFIFDMRDRTIFFKDHIEYNHYWSGKKILIPYSEVGYVETTCEFGAKGFFDVSLEYYIEDKRITILEINSQMQANGLERLSDVDNILRAANTKFVKSTRESSGKDIRSAYLINCFQKLSKQNSNKRYQTIRKILHTDELTPD